MNPKNILVVDDEANIRAQIEEILSDEGYQILTADSASAARQMAREHKVDLALVDIWMPGEDGLSLLKFWRRRGGVAFPILMMSGHGNIETAIEATQLGAWHYLEKPLSMRTLLLHVERTLEASQLRQRNETLMRDAAGLEQIVGRHPKIRELRAQAQKLGQTDAPVLIVGEDGCEHLALAASIHCNSPRHARPLVSNPYPDPAANLFEGDTAQPSLLQSAEGGILFLNSLNLLAAEKQRQLLAALQDHPASIDGDAPAGVRLIATLHESLGAVQEKNGLLPELAELFTGATLTLPPLRERTQDIPELVEHFMRFYCVQENLTWRAVPSPVMQVLEGHPWPGNTRELRLCLYQLLSNGRSNEEISMDELDAILYPEMLGSLITKPYREAREEFERSYYRFHLQQSGGSITHLSSRTGMDRTYLYRKLKELGLRECKTSAEDSS